MGPSFVTLPANTGFGEFKTSFDLPDTTGEWTTEKTPEIFTAKAVE